MNHKPALSILLMGLVTILPARATEIVSVEKRVPPLIEQLADSNFQKRESATQELTEIGKPALPWLEKAANHQDPEVRERVAAIKNSIQPPEPEPTATQGGQVQQVGNGNVVILGGGGARAHVQIIGQARGGGLFVVGGNLETKDLRESFGASFTKSARRIRLSEVKADSTAEKLGLKAGDQILAVNGKEPATLDELETSLLKSDPKIGLAIEVKRQQETLTLKSK